MKTIWFALGLCCLSATVFGAPSCPSAASVAAPPTSSPQMYVSSDPGDWSNSTTLIAGDSIAARWEPALNRTTYNFGHGGDRTEWVLWRLDHADNKTAHFQNAVIIAGTNNSGPRFTPCEIATGVFAIADRLRQNFGIKNIVIVSLIPRGAQLSANENNIEQTNQLLKDNASELGYRYADTYSSFRQKCGHDGACGLYLPGLIHPTPSGYQIYNDLVAPLLH
jgi:beta-glucosidase